MSRRTFRPHRGLDATHEEDGWELVRDEDLVVVPLRQEKEEEEEEDDIDMVKDADDEVPVLLVLEELGEELVLDNDAAIQKFIESQWPRVRHYLAKNEEETVSLDGETYFVVRYCDEIDRVSSQSLWKVATSPSQFRTVQKLKELVSVCTRSPRWKADMASELDLLGRGCRLRADKLKGLLLAKKTFEDRLAGIAQEEDVSSEIARANQAAENQLARRVRQVEDLADSLEDFSSDDGDGKDLLDAILAMILVRLHRPHHELSRLQESVSNAWKDEFGLFPRRADILLASSQSSLRPPPQPPSSK